MRRLAAVALGVATGVVALAPALALLIVTTKDEPNDANIGGGMLLMASIGLGIWAGIWVYRRVRASGAEMLPR